jgi:CRP/FNR family cyclic AMP-dependent transcriptional regulator
MCRVLELDPELGADLDRSTLAIATRELAAPVADLNSVAGGSQWAPEGVDAHLGLMVVEGLLLREVRMLGTSSAELLGPGDLVRPAEIEGEFTLPAPAEVKWTALEPVRVAVLDEVFLAAACRYPAVLASLMRRAIARAKALALHGAVTNLKHVETRLIVQFWHIAERWGRVRGDGVTIAIPLTHDVLARLVGAQRPSVTTALGRLAKRGLVTREGNEWRLSHESRHALGPIPLDRDASV